MELSPFFLVLSLKKQIHLGSLREDILGRPIAAPQPDLFPVALVLVEMDNVLLDNYWRKYQTYLELGWDSDAIHAFLGKKESKLQVASFTTPTVNFTAMNRRDKYDVIFERPELLAKDVPVTNAVEMMQMLVQGLYIVVMSSRSVEQQIPTLDLMRYLGFPVDKMDFFFKNANESIMNFRNRCFAQIQKRFLLGFGLCITPSDSIGFDRLKYPTIGLTTVKIQPDLASSIDYVCDDWNQIGKILFTLLKTIPNDKLSKAQAQLATASSRKFATAASVSSLTAKFEASGGLIAPMPTAFASQPAIISPASAAAAINVPSGAEAPKPSVGQATITKELLDLTAMLAADIAEPQAAAASTPTTISGGELSLFDRAEQRSETQSTLDRAIFYQLFTGSGSDTILGTDENTNIRIENVEMLLNAFMAELKPRLPLIQSRKVAEFFGYFTQRFQLDLAEVQTQVEVNLAAMAGLEDQGNADIYLAITKFVEKLRNITFEHFGIGWISWVFYESTGQTFMGFAQEKFNRLLANNDPDVGLLYNVSFILWLAHIYPDMPYSEQIQEVIKDHAQKLITRLFS